MGGGTGAQWNQGHGARTANPSTIWGSGRTSKCDPFRRPLGLAVAVFPPIRGTDYHCDSGSAGGRPGSRHPTRDGTCSHRQEDAVMSIVDDLVENLVERNALRVSGSFTLTLVNGGIALNGQLLSTLRDQRKNKDLLNMKAPVAADITVGKVVIPLPQIR
jgi:hypothetical protein